MPRNSQTQRSTQNGFALTSIIVLALGRIRHTSLLMGVTTIGMIAAIIIVCVVPAFTSVMNTAGLRSMLMSNATNAEIEVNTNTLGLSTAAQQAVGKEFVDLFQQNMTTTATLLRPSQFSVISTNFTFVSSPPKQMRSLVLYGVDMAQAASHLGKLHGQLPSPTTTTTAIDVLISASSARALQLTVGDSVPLIFSYFAKLPNPRTYDFPASVQLPLTAHISGIFDGDPQQTDYWHGSDFKPLETSADKGRTLLTTTMLISNQSLLSLADELSNQNKSTAILTDNPGFTLRWYYRLDLSHLSIDDLDAMITDMGNVQSAYQAYFDETTSFSLTNPPTFPYLTKTDLTSPMFSQGQTISILELFRQRVAVSRVSAIVLTVQVILLVLFFVSLMTNLLVDRQSEVIALMRSRGASRGQIFGVFLTQCLALGLIAFVLGPVLAIGTLVLMVRQSLPGSGQGALNSVTDHLPQVVQTNALYALSVLLVVLLTMVIQLFIAARMDVLALRRQAARTNRRPLWQRLNLDVIAGVLALLIYGISLYLTSIGTVLEGDARTLIETPLSVMAPFFLLIGGLLLFLRFFPLLLKLASWLTARGKGVTPMLALAQISRAPRQPLRMTMLLALATAFTLFALIYSASETYHIQQITTYMMGADFGGNTNALTFAMDPTKSEQVFRQINGVLSVTAGYTTQARGGKGTIPLEFRALDATTFTATAIWPSQIEKDAGGKLLAQLVKDRQTISKATSVQAIPAIVDTLTASKLFLQVGSSFPISITTLNVSTLQYYVVGIVPSIPTVNSRLVTGVKGTPTPGGVLVDYTTFNTTYTREVRSEKLNDALKKTNPFFTIDPPALNSIWLHSGGDAVSLANIRIAITKPSTRLFNVADRWQMLANLSSDPFYLVLGGILSIGTIAALLLALVGDLLASWLNARTRLVNFAIMRALGSTPGEVTRVLMWEQIIIYATGLLLGVTFGLLLATSMIPALTFTDLNTNIDPDQFYALQVAFPVQVVMPPTLLFGLLGLGILLILTLALSIRVVSRPVLGQMLRLNED